MVNDDLVLAIMVARRQTQRRRRFHRPTSRSGRSDRLLAVLAFVGLIALVLPIGGLIGFALFGRFVGALPPPQDLNAHPLFQTTRVMASDDRSQLYEITDPQGGRRTLISLDQMPRNLIEATISTEDAGFFTNPGIEPRAILRAAVEDLTHGHIVSGASTITQQVVRGILLPASQRTDQSAQRKIKEAIIAYQVTQTYSKDQILELYLNTIFYGNRSYGIEAAAEGYFGKSVGSLDLAECAMLAGIPQAPGYYDPYQRLDAVKQRQRYVLQRMVVEGYITQAQADAAYNEPLHFVDRRHATIAPHFVAYVESQLQKQLGTDRLYHDGDSAVTTLDMPIQTAAEAALRDSSTALAAAGVTNGSIVVLDPRNGHILAMVGSLNYDDPTIEGEVNMAFVPRSSGGVLSPLTYAMGLANGQTLLSPLNVNGVNLTDPGQPAQLVPLGEALGKGMQGPATDLLRMLGSGPFFDLTQQIGIPNLDKRAVYGGNLVLASVQVTPLEVARAYGALADGGTTRVPVALERIVNPSGQTIYQSTSNPSRGLDPGVAYLVTSALADRSYWPDAARQALPGSTPTALHLAESDGQLDSWVAGYTPSVVVVVWLGNTTGGALKANPPTLSIWARVMRAAAQQYPSGDFSPPSNVVGLSLCRTAACSARETVLALAGTQAEVEKAHAQQIAVAAPAAGSSQTPLVNRDQTAPTPAPTPANLAAPVVNAHGQVNVPSVSGLSPVDARQQLTAAGLTVAPLIRYQSGGLPGEPLVAVGQVLGTAPEAGLAEPVGTSVVLIIRRD